MYRRLYRYASPLIVLATTGGCVQMTRHSNMVVFGTNTSVGLRVGTSATSVPEIQLGYSRQEAVALPVVANTSGRTGRDGSDLLEPCDLTQPVVVTGGAQFAVHPCSLVAINGSSLDSYSVLASFGANFDASARTTDVTARGGLAQYFATGMAAQMLALNGGAAVVAVGEAARTASANPPSPAAVQSLFGNSSAYAIGQSAAATYPNFRQRLEDLVNAAATDADVAAKILNFETNAGINTPMRASCATKAACLAAIRHNDYAQSYNRNKAQMETALGRW